MELNIYTYKNKDFYLLDELKEYDPKFFYGCAQKGPEKIVEKKNILDYEVVKYTKKTDGDYDWSESTFSYKRSKLLVGLKWAASNIPKLCGKKNGYKYDEAPPLLELSEEECLKDKNGHILNVEVRGERNEDKVVFKAKDIARIFEMENLPKTINDKRGDYIKGEDYHIFNTTGPVSNGSCENRIRPYTFLTYNGLLKVVFESRSGIARNFRKWATKVIYTTHMGTAQQREEVSRIVLKADPKSVKTVLGKSVSETSCIYLFALGKVKDLRKLDLFKEILKDYSDNSIVYKWGRTIDLKRRTGEHNVTYGVFEGVKVILEIYAHIDPTYIVYAENDIKAYLNQYNSNISFQNFKELIVLNKSEFLETKEKYNDLHEQYGGCLKQFVVKNNQQEQTIKELTYQLTIKNKDVELLNKDVELERSKTTLLEKEMEILNLKIQLT